MVDDIAGPTPPLTRQAKWTVTTFRTLLVHAATATNVYNVHTYIDNIGIGEETSFLSNS